MGGAMLTFNIKKEWFEKIKSGEKTHEYREVKDYWTTRITNYFHIDIDKLKSGTTYWYTGSFDIIFRMGYVGEKLRATTKSIKIIAGLNSDLKIDKPVYDIEFELIKKV